MRRRRRTYTERVRAQGDRYILSRTGTVEGFILALLRLLTLK